jgi:cytidyltransferase-like protein
MKIGLYFGSFNPIHNGHLIVANYILNETDLEKIWLVVSPQNPLKNENTLLNEYHRLHLATLATEHDTRIKPTDIEFTLPKPSYTIDTLLYLKEKYPQHEFRRIRDTCLPPAGIRDHQPARCKSHDDRCAPASTFFYLYTRLHCQWKIRSLYVTRIGN